MREYELLCVLPGTLAETDVAPVTERVTTLLSDIDAKDTTHTSMGKSRLSYPIQHIRYGYFELFHFSAEPEAVKALEEKLRIQSDLLRAMVSLYNKERREKKDEILKKLMKAAPQKKSAPMAEEAQPAQETKETQSEQVDVAAIDKKLDEILDSSMENV